MKHFLDNVIIGEPEGMSGLYMEKPRSSRYGGVLRINKGSVKNVGQIKGVGQMLITEPVAIGIMEKAVEKHNVDANVNYLLMDDDGTKLIDAEINLANYQEKPEGWSITLRDPGELEALVLQADTVVSITPTKEFTLESFALAQSVTHTINEELIKVAWKTPASKNPSHFPAWKAQSSKAEATGTPQSISEVYKETPVWVNSTGDAKQVYVTARLSIAHRSATTMTGQLILYVLSGIGSTTYTIVDIELGSSLTEKTYAVDREITVQQNGQVFFKLSFIGTSADYEFNYKDDSYLCINPDNATPSSVCKGLYAIDALRAIVAQITPSITITNEVKALEKEWITNGYNLRGVVRDLQVSFGGLWDDFKKLHNIMLHRVNDNELVIKDFSNFIDKLDDGIIMNDVQTWSFIPALDILFSRVNVGFDKWASGTPTGNEEKYGNEKYSTGLQKINNVLDLECKTLCASEKLIETIRRKQFDIGGNRQDKDDDNDEQIFIVADDAYPITTEQVLENWGGVWSVSSQILTKTGGSPDNSSKTIHYAKPQFTGRLARVEGVLTSREWVATGDVLTFWARNKKIRVFVNNPSFRPGAAGSGADANTIIEGYVLK